VTRWTTASASGPLISISPHGAVLFDHAFVFDRHVPAAEIDHLGSHAPVDGVERGTLQLMGGRGHEQSG
jgi:hypothetical protein